MFYSLNYIFKYFHFVVFLIAMFFLASCEKMIAVDNPTNKVIGAQVFQSEALSKSAVIGIYSDMMATIPYLTCGGLSVYGSLLSDENIYLGTEVSLKQFAENEIESANSTNYYYLWAKAYQLLYTTNYCIEGLSSSQSISVDTKNQLISECKFIRGFIYFYLNQLYGQVPVVLTTDYTVSSVSSRADNDIIAQQILADLNDAYNNFSTSTVTFDVFRPSKYSAAAMLSRVYLYQRNWKKSEEFATAVINSSNFELVKDLNKVFLTDSRETIWQLSPTITAYNTVEAASFVPKLNTQIPTYQIRKSFIYSFESTDKRKEFWTSFNEINGDSLYYPYKYKIRPDRTSGFSIKESNVVFRLAEQYLIRSEARAMQNDINGGTQDLDSIRVRAGLSLVTISNKEDLVKVIMQERQKELFSEWGHRWFDLKRTKMLDAVIPSLKSKWQATDSLLPIPNAERLLNPYLSQNLGYN
jgi:starch-binding outer membrane protein, SusD/RagB family